jgi:predicted RNA methylase
LAAKAREAIAAPRLANTPRRVEQARIAVERAERELLIGQLAVAIADNPPPSLVRVKAVREVTELYNRLRKGAFVVAHRNGWSSGRVEEVDLREAAVSAPSPNLDTYAVYARLGINGTLALREALLALVDLMPTNVARDPVKEIEAELVGARIPGFFPTPKDLARRMVFLAGVKPGGRWLEPSAGSGNIAEALRDAGAEVVCVERNHTLCRLLRAKEFEVLEQDFLAYHSGGLNRPMAGAVMNPPFEDGRDIEHVMHAFEVVAPAGIIVAIMSCGPFFRTDGKARRFQQWLAAVAGLYIEDLPPGTFNHRDVTQRTGVAAKLIVIRKEQL